MRNRRKNKGLITQESKQDKLEDRLDLINTILSNQLKLQQQQGRAIAPVSLLFSLFVVPAGLYIIFKNYLHFDMAGERPDEQHLETEFLDATYYQDYGYYQTVKAQVEREYDEFLITVDDKLKAMAGLKKMLGALQYVDFVDGDFGQGGPQLDELMTIDDDSDNLRAYAGWCDRLISQYNIVTKYANKVADFKADQVAHSGLAVGIVQDCYKLFIKQVSNWIQLFPQNANAGINIDLLIKGSDEDFNELDFENRALRLGKKLPSVTKLHHMLLVVRSGLDEINKYLMKAISIGAVGMAASYSQTLDVYLDAIKTHYMSLLIVAISVLTHRFVHKALLNFSPLPRCYVPAEVLRSLAFSDVDTAVLEEYEAKQTAALKKVAGPARRNGIIAKIVYGVMFFVIAMRVFAGSDDSYWMLIPYLLGVLGDMVCSYGVGYYEASQFDERIDTLEFELMQAFAEVKNDINITTNKNTSLTDSSFQIVASNGCRAKTKKTVMNLIAATLVKHKAVFYEIDGSILVSANQSFQVKSMQQFFLRLRVKMKSMERLIREYKSAFQKVSEHCSGQIIFSDDQMPCVQVVIKDIDDGFKEALMQLGFITDPGTGCLIYVYDEPLRREFIKKVDKAASEFLQRLSRRITQTENASTANSLPSRRQADSKPTKKSQRLADSSSPTVEEEKQVHGWTVRGEGVSSQTPGVFEDPIDGHHGGAFMFFRLDPQSVSDDCYDAFYSQANRWAANSKKQGIKTEKYANGSVGRVKVKGDAYGNWGLFVFKADRVEGSPPLYYTAKDIHFDVHSKQLRK